MKKWILFLTVVVLAVASDILRSKKSDNIDGGLSTTSKKETSGSSIMLQEAKTVKTASTKKNIASSPIVEKIKTDRIPKPAGELIDSTYKENPQGRVPANTPKDARQAIEVYFQAEQAILESLTLNQEQMASIQQADDSMREAIQQAQERGQPPEVIDQAQAEYESALQNIMGPEAYHRYQTDMTPYRQVIAVTPHVDITGK